MGSQKRRGIVVYHVAFVLLLSVAALTRLHNLDSHFTHIDDIGVAKTILDARTPGYFGQRLSDESSPTYNNPIKRALRSAMGDRGLSIADRVAPWIAVPMSWTYAPAQFVLTNAMLPSGGDYRRTLFLGRLPSALFSIASLLAMLWVSRRVHGPYWRPWALLAVVLLACSWEHVLLSQQMHNYAAGTFAVLLAIGWSLAITPERVRLASYASLALLGAALGSLVYVQYQLIFVGTACLLALAWATLAQGRGERAPLLRLAAIGAAFALVCLPGVVYIALKDLAGVSWNAGPTQQFLFSWDRPAADALYLSRFFVGGLHTVISRMMAFVPEHAPVAALLFPVTTLGCVAGVVLALRSQTAERRRIGMLALCLFAVWASLCVAGRITLSPTRHSVVLLPLFVLLFCEAVRSATDWLMARFGPRFLEWQRAAYILPPLLVLALFYKDYSATLGDRQDPFDEVALATALSLHGVDDVVAYGATLNPYLMPALGGLHLHDTTVPPEDMGRIEQASTPVAFVSARTSIEEDPSDAAAAMAHLVARGWEVVLTQERRTPVELEYSRLTQNGQNNFFLYVLKPATPSTAGQ